MGGKSYIANHDTDLWVPVTERASHFRLATSWAYFSDISLYFYSTTFNNLEKSNQDFLNESTQISNISYKVRFDFMTFDLL